MTDDRRRLKRLPRYPGPLPSGVVGRATADGWRAAVNGQYDEWSFNDVSDLPYIIRLRAEAAAALHVEKRRLFLEIREIRETLRDAKATRGERLIRDQAAVDVARDRVTKYQERRSVTMEELDFLAGVHEPLPSELGEDGRSVNQEVLRRRWMGPADGTLAPPVPGWLKFALIVLLSAIEIPIYFGIFRSFHPRDLALVWCFTLPVALTMVLGPHLTGIWLRHRHARPSVGTIPTVVAAIVMTAWSTAAVLLADMRRHSLMLSPVIEGVRLDSGIDISPASVTAVFSLLLILSGLIAFLLGMAQSHPGVTAFRAADRRAEEAENDYLVAISSLAGAKLDHMLSEDERIDSAKQQSDQHIAELQASFHAAEAAYLDAITLALADPSVTHATAMSVPPVDGRTQWAAAPMNGTGQFANGKEGP